MGVEGGKAPDSPDIGGWWLVAGRTWLQAAARQQHPPAHHHHHQHQLEHLATTPSSPSPHTLQGSTQRPGEVKTGFGPLLFPQNSRELR